MTDDDAYQQWLQAVENSKPGELPPRLPDNRDPVERLADERHDELGSLIAEQIHDAANHRPHNPERSQRIGELTWALSVPQERRQ